VLSALVPGAGQLFLGRKKRATVLFLALIAIAAGFWPARLPKSYFGLVFLLWMCLFLSLYAIFEALLAQDTRLPGRMSRWWIFAGIPLGYLGVNLIFTSLLVASGFRTYRFASPSMEPTIFRGDKFVSDQHYYRHRSPHRSDLVLMRLPDSVTVKRVIAVDGDTIEGEQRQIFLNGRLQDEPFVKHEFGGGTTPELDTFGPVQIPPGKYFVMGDNRDVSLDSRTADFGLIDQSAILGKPLYGYRVTGKPLSWELH
jgi:signal peptidase I